MLTLLACGEPEVKSFWSTREIQETSTPAILLALCISSPILEQQLSLPYHVFSFTRVAHLFTSCCKFTDCHSFNKVINCHLFKNKSLLLTHLVIKVPHFHTSLNTSRHAFSPQLMWISLTLSQPVIMFLQAVAHLHLWEVNSSEPQGLPPAGSGLVYYHVQKWRMPAIIMREVSKARKLKATYLRPPKNINLSIP